MELVNKTFDINGEHKKVVNTDDTFAFFKDGACIRKDLLVTKYSEVMDPSSFFNPNASGLENLANDINNINTNNIMESNTQTIVNDGNIEQHEEIIETPNVQQVETPSVTRIDNSGLKNQQTSNNDFFSKIKRNNLISIDFSIEEKFPDLDFVRMMNDNYETSIIEHFANEIVEKMVYDPTALLESVKRSINIIVYGEEVSNENKELENEQESESTIVENTEDNTEQELKSEE